MTAIYQGARFVVPEPIDGEPLRWHPLGQPLRLDLVPLAVEEQVWTALRAGASEVEVAARGVGSWRRWPMPPELTPEQWAKLARGWVWQVGQAAIWTGAQGTMPVRVALDPQVPGYLVVSAADGGHNAVKISNLTPDLTDPVTADGMERTVNAMYGGIHDVYLYPNDDGSWDAYLDTMPGGWRIGTGATKQAALLAAILAAPEAT